MKRYALALTASLALTAPAWAGGTHDHSPQHGGLVTEAKDLDLELVLKPQTAQLYVRGHGKPVDLKQAGAKLTLLAGTEKQDIELKPAGEKLEASGSFKTASGTKAVVVLNLNGKAVTARFVVK